MKCQKIPTCPLHNRYSSHHSFVDTSVPPLRSLLHMNSRSLRRFVVFVLSLAAIASVQSEQPSPHSHRELTIAVLVSLTGSWNSLRQDTVAALPLANEHLPAAAKAEPGRHRFR